MIDFETQRHGSAGFCSAAMRRRAGLYRRSGAFIGNDEAGRACHSDQQSAIVLCGGARVGKGNFIIPWLVDGLLQSDGIAQHIISLDWKGQNGIIAGLQVQQRRHVYSYNPRAMRGAPQHRINPTSHLRADSPSLVADALLSSASWIPMTNPKAAYFEGSAQRILTAATVTLARSNGVVTLPELADKMAGLGSASDEWLSFEYDISTQPEPEIREVAQELREFRASSGDGAGFKGIKGEISRSFTCLMDPQVRDALSPPYDFCFSWLTQDDHPATLVNIMEDLEFALTSGPVIRALFTCALIYKRRNLSARPQFWCLDEIGNCGAWPLAETMATANAGYGIRTAYVVQSTRQLENLKPGAGEVIPNSCGTAIYLGTRSLPQASQVSKQLGRITLEYDDFAQQERARAAHAKAVREIVLSGADPIQTALEAQHHKRLATNRTKMPRDLRSPDEVMNEANDRAFVFMPGVLERPFYAHVPKYWRRRDLAGRYLADPFHGPANTVEVGRWFGQSRRPVITTRVPEALADWPQYRDAETWSYVQGYRPSLSGL